MTTYPFSGVYPDFSAIPSSPWYNQPGLLERARNNVAALRTQRDDLATQFLGSKQLLPTVVESMGGCERILDFGGASGLDFAGLLAATSQTRTDIHYTVVDFDAACEVGREVWLGDQRIAFRSDVPKSQFDLVYSCSSLQYEPDYQARLRSFSKMNPKIVLLLRHPISSIEFARQQHVLSGSFPQWVMSIDKVVNALPGYRLVFRNFSEDVYDVSNYRQPFDVGGSMNLIFVRQ